MKVSFQGITLVLLLTAYYAASCPLPGDTCTSLPENNFSYDEYLDRLPTSPNYHLQVNATRLDSAFNPRFVSDGMALASITDIKPGCEERNFNFTILNGANGVLDLKCPFTFVCDYNPQRVPAHIFHARCTASEIEGTKCREVFYPVVTMTTESCDPLREQEGWLMQTEFVAVSCIAAQ